jgi:hypothetical protein
MKLKLITLIVAGVLVSGVMAYAHHSFTATYQANKVIKIEGKILQFLFRNPHSFLHVMAPDESGTMLRWAIEWQGAGQLGAGGVTGATLKAGDPVIVTGNPGRDASEHRIRLITIKRTTDGFGWGTNPGEVVN